MPPSLTVKMDRLSKRFGRQWVIQDFSEQFGSGEVIGIKGRNGSGKSTLLRMICGQLTPSRGSVAWQLAGRNLALENRYRHVSWTGPYTEVIEELTIAEMLGFHFGLKPLREGLSVEDIPVALELENARNRPLMDCSSGMRQRVLLGTALFADTPLLVLDEPTVTLDAQARAWFQDRLSEAKRGRLTVIASNDEEDLRQCSRIVSLNSAI
ncbi:ABC transporter ATP-binding protein [Neolewinella antarctica]|uniref:ABC-type multidrug transport system ATPase subunit n=1 Tax=Neolewinella antarctica TaxID=442734 RepID=A0ABX0X6J1_9BACT|nr:ABC transporter ATP-binding protein [Neolewinella antarctica]NJC24629.1 ABC-type multidrug transport system ATPase subunit [Neolewinella antarctica]